MKVIEMLARLTTKPQSFEISSKSFNALSQSDIAYLLKGLDELSQCLVRAKYVNINEEKEKIKLYRHLNEQLAPLVDNVGYRIGLALSLTVDITDSNRCKQCRGVGQTVRLSKVTECSGCAGTGYKYLSGRKISKTCGMDESAYRRKYKAIYLRVREKLENIERGAIDHINRNYKTL